MKSLLFAISLFAAINFSIAQGCLPEGITFSSQSQIDNFQTNYPGCTEIEGSVTIQQNAQVTNLDGLNVITSIGGDFITRNSMLGDITGLSNLITIGGALEIAGNAENLTSLSGLENLVSIDSSLIIYHTYLTDLNGLNNLSVIGDHLRIGSIEFIWPGQFNCLSNPNLMSLEGLESLVIIGGQLHVYCNEILTDFSGLENLVSVNGILIGEYGDDDCCGNNSLETLSGLESLNSVGTYLQIFDNSSLIDISGLNNADFSTLNYLGLAYNSSLSNCAIQNICDHISEPGIYFQVFENADGCNSTEEVEETCFSSIDEISNEASLLISPNPAPGITTLSFKISKPGMVICDLFDFSGTKIKSMVNEVKASGYYEKEFDLSNIPAGVYFCILKTTHGLYSKKLVIL